MWLGGIMPGVERISTLAGAWERKRESMRIMVKFTFPTTEELNARIRDGSIGQTMETMLGDLQPEAAYFGPTDGKRGGYLVFNMEDASELVTKLEPFWLELGATIETFPVMSADDLRAGLQRLQVAPPLLMPGSLHSLCRGSGPSHYQAFMCPSAGTNVERRAR